MIYGYARVSTAGQATDGNGLEVQERVLREHGAEVIFADRYTGTKKSRPQFDMLMQALKPGDTLIVSKLDRIARSAVHGSEIISDLMERDVRVNVLNMGMLDNSPAGKLIRTVFFGFAEFERDMILERTREGKAVAKEREGYREGRPRVEVPGFEMHVEDVRQGRKTVQRCCEELGISRRSWYNLVSRARETA